MIVGRVIGGSVSDKLIIRVKNNSNISVGDLLIVETGFNKFFIKVVDKTISSLVPNQFIEEVAGLNLEFDEGINLFDEKERFFPICFAKVLKIMNKGGDFLAARNIPYFFSDVRTIVADDFKFLEKKGQVPIGCLRLGTNFLKDVIIKLPANKLISHHVLITAATGKGKSNFAKVFVSGLLDSDNVSCLIIDPHAEYFGTKGVKGLSYYKNKNNKIEYFTPSWENFSGSVELKVFTEDLNPIDFHGVVELSEAQREAMDALYQRYGVDWIRVLVSDKPANVIQNELRTVGLGTILALRRRILYTLDLEDGLSGIVFSIKKRVGVSLFEKIKQGIVNGKTIIIDTSLLSSEAERLISASIVRKMFSYFRRVKQIHPDRFNFLPELMIVFEEAPRVLGKSVLSHGTNIFEKIAREGRKFKVGLCAITQMPSLIPKEILSQMNTKIILGLPSPSDRQAVIDSSAQSINDEGVEIQMLDKGEAIITSPFTLFPLPVKVFYFNDILNNKINNDNNNFEVGL